MKVLLLADGAVGLAITQRLVADYPEDLALVVTTERNEISHAAEVAGIAACTFGSEESLLAMMPGGVDLGLLAWWPRILKGALLEAPRNGFVNTHPSFLPYNRGKHYNFWALVEQNVFGVSLHRVDPGVDTGEVIAQKQIDYDWCDTGETLYRKAEVTMVELFVQTYPSLRTGAFRSTPQDLESGTFHHSSELDRASRVELDREYTARDLLNLLRARTFKGFPGCWFEEEGKRYEIAIEIREVDH